MDSVGHKPTGRWSFDEDVTDCFDDMLRRSIPQYDVMRRSCIDVSRRFFSANTLVYDLGCSRGDVLWSAFEAFGGQALYVGFEISKPMLESCAARFKSLQDCGIVRIREHDLRTGAPIVNASIVFSVLTLQFIPINYRQRLLRDAYSGLLPGGALIIVEKLLGDGVMLDDMMVALYHDLKGDNGYSADDIERKRCSLESILVPVTARYNVDLMRSAGFDEVDCFWRWMNFAGFVGVKR